MTYNEYVREVAEEMASAYFPSTKEAHPDAWEGAVLHKMKFAHIAVAREANRLILWCFVNIQMYHDDTVGKHIMDKKLIELGLIPNESEK